MSATDTAALRQELQRLELRKALMAASDDFLAYCQMMMPHPEAPEDPNRTLYHVAKHHKLLAKYLTDVEAGRILRLIIEEPPRHGKTQQASKFFPSWFTGRQPWRSTIFTTYNDDYAGDIGRDVRDLFRHPRYAEIFPAVALKKGSAASNRLKTNQGGMLSFIGRGGSTTGRGGDLAIVDDPIKDAKEADSPTIRDDLWEWFTRVLMTRLMTSGAAVIIIMTRWHEDDLVGRLTDPQNPHYDPQEASKWKRLRLPAEAEPGDELGRAPGEPLWPERFPLKFLHAQRRLNPRGYSALYQQRPSPPEGAFFQAKWIKLYRKAELPPIETMQLYATSDHAVGQDGIHDKSCYIIAGVDQELNIWILDCWWERANSRLQVEAMLHMMEKYEPTYWWAEDSMITKSLGPYLFRKKAEKQISTTVDYVKPTKNKMARAQAIAALMSEGRVRFPADVPWLANARHELLSFPNATHDDFVDAIAWLGLKLLQITTRQGRRVDDEPKPHTLAWLKKEAAHQDRLRRGRTYNGW